MVHDDTEDLQLTMMEQQPWTQQLNHKLLIRFQDELLQPPLPLPEMQIAEVPSPLFQRQVGV